MQFLFSFLRVFIISTSLLACGGGGSRLDDSNDPFEGINRASFRLNLTLDKYLIKPIAQTYLYVPSPVRTGIRNFLSNLSAPITLANDALQGEMARAGTTTSRLAINTTLGVGGLFDVASEMGLPAHREDFGQTLGVYGVGEGIYLYFILLGPSNARDFSGDIVDLAFNPLTYTDHRTNNTLAQQVLHGLDLRAENIDLLDEIERSSVDFYASIRSLYQQNRRAAIANGALDIDALPDIDDLDDF